MGRESPFNSFCFVFLELIAFTVTASQALRRQNTQQHSSSPLTASANMQMLHSTTGAQATKQCRRSACSQPHTYAALRGLSSHPRRQSTTSADLKLTPAVCALPGFGLASDLLRATVTVCRASPDANVAVQESLQGRWFQGCTPKTAAHCFHCRLLTLAAAAAAATADYICKGPLLAAACITPAQVQQDLGTWQKLGQQLALQLGFDHDSMDDIQK